MPPAPWARLLLGAARGEGLVERDKAVTSGAGRANLTLKPWLLHVGEACRILHLKGLKASPEEAHCRLLVPFSSSSQGKLANPLHLRMLPSEWLALDRENRLQPPAQAPLVHT